MARQNLLTLGFIGLAAIASCTRESQRVPEQRLADPDIALKVYFDGGYVYDLAQDGKVQVAALRQSAHPMKVRVLAGSTNTHEIDLAGARLQIWPNGTSPQNIKPELPPYDDSSTGCELTQLAKKNNRLFVPDLAYVAGQMATTVKNTFDVGAAIDLTGGGALSVDDLGGCVEFRDANNQTVGQKRWMVSGLLGMKFEWPITSGSQVTLVKVPLGGGTPTKFEVKPVGKEITLWVSSTFGVGPEAAKPPYKIEHFKHFDGAFENLVESKRVTLWWLGGPQASPGIDCPPGRRGP